MSNFDYEELDSKPTLQDAIAELKSDAGSVPGPSVLYGLSGLSNSELQTLQPVWDSLDDTYRRVLMQMMVDAMDENFELNYRPIAEANLQAPQAEVRRAAVEMLWEASSLPLMDRFIQMAQDPSPEVREEVAKALGRFVLWGELGDLPEQETKRAQDTLLTLLDNPDEAITVHRYALEGLANCSRRGITQRIQAAYDSGEPQLREGAVIAMGHTCNGQRWGRVVLDVLDDPDVTLRRHAAKAAGELQLDEAVPALLRLLEEDEREGQEIAIWSLGEIGGKEAVRVLESIADMAEEVGDDDLLDIVDDALGNASLMNGDLMLMADLSDLSDEDDLLD